MALSDSKFSKLARVAFGNVLEWYDFSLYIYFSISLGHAFFPSDDPLTVKLLSFATFFIGALVRPLGGLLLGWLGDRFGLRWSVNLCVKVMGVSTVLVAFLPTYAQVGLFAPVMLILLRILQGLSAGGQFPNLITLSVNEHKKKSGFAVGLIFSISSLGFLLASGVGFLMTSWITDLHNTLLWRLPFAFSGFLFLFYMWLNRHEAHTQESSKTAKPPLLPFLKKHWQPLLAVVCLTTMAASLYMLLYTYVMNYRIDHLGVSAGNAFLINAIILLVAICSYPLFGKLSDRFGNLTVFLVSAGILVCVIYPSMLYLNAASSVETLAILLLITVLLAAIQGAISPLFAQGFPAAWQATGCALAFSIGNALSGGAPMAVEYAVHVFDHGLADLFLLFTLIGLLGMMFYYRSSEDSFQFFESHYTVGR